MLEENMNDSEVPISYIPKVRQFGIDVLDGGTSFIEIKYCPWCGSKLPNSLRDIWFDSLEELIPDFDGFADSRIPNEFHSDEWWKKRGL